MIEFSAHSDGNGLTVIRPEGRLNMVAAPMFSKLITSIVEAGDTRIVVDLSSIAFIDSSGLGALISGLRTTRQAGGDLRIAAPTAQVESVLSLTNVNRILHAYPSAEDAFADD